MTLYTNVYSTMAKLKNNASVCLPYEFRESLHGEWLEEGGAATHELLPLALLGEVSWR